MGDYDDTVKALMLVLIPLAAVGSVAVGLGAYWLAKVLCLGVMAL